MADEPDDGSASSRGDAERSSAKRNFVTQASDQQFRALVEAVEDYAIFRLGPEGEVVSWNPGAERIKGYTDQEILGEHFSTFYTEEDRRAGVPESNLAAAADRGSIEDEGWRARADGSRFWANVTLTAIRDEDGDLEGFAKVTRDMTERRRREEQLRSERDFTEQVLDTAPASIFVLDASGDVVMANDRLGEKLGMDEVAGELSVGDLMLLDETGEPVPPEERPYRTAFRTGEATNGWQCQVELPSGARRWVSVNVTPIFDGQGNVERVIVAAQDITQLREQAERLERQREDLESELSEVFERVDEAFISLDEDWRITYVNDRATGLVRLSAGELLGSRVWDVLPEVAEGRPREMAEEAMATQESVEFKFYSDELDIWVEVRGYPSESGMSVYFRDITDRKDREQELKRYETLIEESTDVNAILGPDGTFRYLTPSVTHVLGYESGELVGEVGFDYIHSDDVEAAMAEYSKMVENPDYRAETEFRFRHADGSWVWLEARGRNLWDDPTIDGIVAYTRDITGRKRYEERLNETVEKLEESNERLEQFAYVASHDLQEPLRMVSSYLQLLENRYGQQFDDEAREFIDYAIDGAERMREMIDDLLAYSRIDTEAEPLEPTTTETVVENVLRDLQLQIHETDAEVSIESLPTVHADRNQLEQLFRNLVSNAIKYRGDEPPKIEIGAERDGGRYVFRVADNGIGMDPAQTERIFDVFDRLHTHDEYQGTGIGLALCKKIVERHGGEIWADTEPGEGTTFYVSLPATDSDS